MLRPVPVRRRGLLGAGQLLGVLVGEDGDDVLRLLGDEVGVGLPGFLKPRPRPPPLFNSPFKVEYFPNEL
jgi:hypothetical protein